MVFTKKRSFVSIVFTLLFCLLIIPFGIAHGKVWYVDRDIAIPGDGTSWATSFQTIHEGVDAANEETNDEVWVKAGEYLFSSQIELYKAIGIYGGFAGWENEKDQRDWKTNETVVKGPERYFREYYFYVTSDAILDGFTLTRCFECDSAIFIENSSPIIANCTISGGDPYASQTIHNLDSSPMFTNCTVQNIYRKSGGVIYNDNSSVTVEKCIFTKFGGGTNHGSIIYNKNSYLSITDSTFSEGSGRKGGAIYLLEFSFATITNCSFLNFSVDDRGGAIHNEDGSSLTITDSVFSQNGAGILGGAISNGGSLIINNCSFLNNSSEYGGVIFNSGIGSSSIIINSTFWQNRARKDGGVIYNSNNFSTAITNCTFSENSSDNINGGTCSIIENSNSLLSITNSILWDQIDNCDEIVSIGSTPVVTYCDIKNGYSGTGNIDEDPLFIDPAIGDLHLTADSPCIDQATSVGAPDDDMDGDQKASRIRL